MARIGIGCRIQSTRHCLKKKEANALFLSKKDGNPLAKMGLDCNRTLVLAADRRLRMHSFNIAGETKRLEGGCTG